MAAEGGTSGKNSSTQQSSSQLTSNTSGSNSPTLAASDGGQVNSGSQLQVSGGDVNFSDYGAIERAFDFGDKVAAGIGKVFVSQSDANAAQTSAAIAALGNSSTAGQSADSNKTILYVVAAALAVVGVLIFARR